VSLDVSLFILAVRPDWWINHFRSAPLAHLGIIFRAPLHCGAERTTQF